ncbi:MAG: DUF5104 domain-containing protein [Eubacterium sp.]|nr:DUF5104 domain-containing protein [Eubacterium sp.]
MNAKSAIKVLFVQLMVALCVLLNGCGIKLIGYKGIKNAYSRTMSTAQELVTTSNDKIDKDMNAFIKALDAHDKGALRKCFSSYVQKNDKELDQEIDELFAAYPGPTDSWKWSMDSTQSYSSASDEAREYVTHTAILKSYGKNYYIYIEYTEGEYAGKDRYGICCVDFTTPEVQAALRSHRLDLIDYKSKSSWEQEDHYKIHVTTKHKGDYETRRICNYEEIFNPSEVKYSAHEYVSFVKTNHSIKDFQIKYGMENAGDEDCLYYQVNDGDNLYVMLFKGGKEGQDITQIDLVNEDNYVKTLYVEPE